MRIPAGKSLAALTVATGLALAGTVASPSYAAAPDPAGARPAKASYAITTNPGGGQNLLHIDARTGARTAVLASAPRRNRFVYDVRQSTVGGQPRVSYLAGGAGYCGRHELRLADSAGRTLRTVRVPGNVDLRSGSFAADGSATYTTVACPDKAAGPRSLARRAATVNGTWTIGRNSASPRRVSHLLARAATSASPVVRSKVLPNHYIHQLWGTEANFNGSWACSATSAVMSLAGYQITNPWLSHRAPAEYGDYITQVHTLADKSVASYTAPAPSINDPDPYDGVYQNGGPVYWPGAYGWTVDGNGEGHADWIVSYNKAWGAHPEYIDGTDATLQYQIDHGYFVIVGGKYALPAGASGHYAVVVGYRVHSDGKVTYIVNDPYGYQQTGAPNGAGVDYSLAEMRGQVFIRT